jgi:hypothetical protein
VSPQAAALSVARDRTAQAGRRRGDFPWHGDCTLFREAESRKRGDDMNTRKTIIALSIAALIPMGAAMAGEGKDHDKSGMHSSFKKLDTNKDGRISQAEASADSTIVFSSADANGDGYLDSTEWKTSTDTGSSRPQSSSSPSQSDPTLPQGTEPSGTPPPDTETPRQ